MRALRIGHLLGALTITVLGLSGCAAAGAPEPSASVTSAEVIEVHDAWTKATDEDMTGSFMVIENVSDADIELVAAHSDVAGMVELHEMVDQDGTMVMREVDGALVIPAGGELILEPGGFHVMLMELDGAIEPGATVTVELEFADGSTLDVETVAKDFAAGNEEYEPDADHDDH